MLVAKKLKLRMNLIRLKQSNLSSFDDNFCARYIATASSALDKTLTKFWHFNHSPLEGESSAGFLALGGGSIGKL